MSGCERRETAVDRRDFLKRFGLGLGSLALGDMAAGSADAAGVLSAPHAAAKAKRVIFLFQSGGPSQLDLFDYKPELNRRNGEDLPESVRMGQRLTGITSVPKFQTSDTDGRTQFGDERPFVELIRRHCRNIDVAYLTADDVSPVEGMRQMLRMCGDPFPAPAVDSRELHGVRLLLHGLPGHRDSRSGQRDRTGAGSAFP